MNLRARKTGILSIAAILVLTFSMILIAIPAASAAETTYAFLSVQPNPSSLGQKLTVNVWLEPPPVPATGGRQQNRYHDYTVTIKDSSGAVVATLKSPNSDPLGSWQWTYTPTAIGAYTATFTYPGETFPDPYNIVREGATTTYKFEVVEQARPEWPNVPLPSGYWTRPISADIQGWWSITGNWLQSGYNATSNSENMWSSYPASPHIMWTISQKFGGISGGAGGQLTGDGFGFGSVSYHVGEAYESEMPNPLIVLGRLYVPVPVDNIATKLGTACYDVRTGELIWTNPNLRYSEAQLFDYESINQGGTHAYLWSFGSTYILYDAFTGTQICNFSSPGQTASPSLTSRDNHGSLLAYILSVNTGRMRLWNSSKAFDENGLVTYQSALVKQESGIYGGQLRVVEATNTTATPGGSWNWTKGLEYDVTKPSNKVIDTNSFRDYIECDGVLMARSSTSPVNTHQSWAAYKESTGDLMWNISLQITPYGGFAAGCGLLMNPDVNQARWIAIDVQTGKTKWTTESMDIPWGIYGINWQFNNGIGFSTSYAGVVHAIDIKTGRELWNWAPNVTYAPEQPSGQWFGGFGASVPGVLTYRTIETWSHGTLEHGHAIYALNTTTGKPIWNITGWYGSSAIADGYLVAMNLYTNQITCFGIGTSATTVTASPKSFVSGNSVVIEGTVTDASVGSPAKGTAAISDADMGPWMEYIVQQKSIPANAKGVSVSLDTVDPNGNYVHIGDTTSDSDGVYSFVWTPSMTGKYTIISTFQGSGAYGPSHAKTAINVEQAPAPTSTPTPVTQAPLDMYILGATAAIIIAIAIVGLLILRRKP